MRRLLPTLTTISALALLSTSAGALPKPALGAPRVHVVYPGQTLAMIAKRYRTSVEALCKANGITRRSPIRPKQRLVIPRDPGEVVPAAISKEVEHEEEAKTARPSKKERGAYAATPQKRGQIALSSYTGSWRGQVLKKGKITDGARTGIEKVLASWRTGQHQPINDRLIKLLVKVSDHFGGRAIRVVSGYRPYSPSQYTPHSRHNTGHAVDFSIPGVPNSVLRDYCRTLPNVGCGYYPNSSFVHMDVRETSAYWVDFSGPGQAPRYADAQGRDPGEAAAAGEKEEPASGLGDGADGSDDSSDSDEL
jgi:uncharacterized protein YcbK (DUF882 family)